MSALGESLPPEELGTVIPGTDREKRENPGTRHVERLKGAEVSNERLHEGGSVDRPGNVWSQVADGEDRRQQYGKQPCPAGSVSIRESGEKHWQRLQKAGSQYSVRLAAGASALSADEAHQEPKPAHQDSMNHVTPSENAIGPSRSRL